MRAGSQPQRIALAMKCLKTCRPKATATTIFACPRGNAVGKARRSLFQALFCGPVHIARHAVQRKLPFVFKTQGRVLTMARVIRAALLALGLAFAAGVATAQTPATAE